MLFLLLATGLGLLALPALARPIGRQLPAAEWAKLCLVAVVGGGLAVETAAVLYAAPTVATASGMDVLAHLCQRMLGPLAPGGPVVGWTAAAVAVTLPVLAGLGWLRAHRVTSSARIEPGLGHHQRRGPYDLVVLPTDQVLAVSVPTVSGAGRGQIVLSEGLVRTLTPDQLHAVVRHEAAHLRHGHHRYLTVTAAADHAFAWLPLARWSTATLRLSLERWADEDAVARTGDRPTVRDALLAVTASLVADPSIAAFSAAETICERLDALDADPPRPRRVPHLLLYLPGSALAVVASLAMACWISGAGALVAGLCTS